MWGGADDSDSISAIHAAIDSGVNLIDTAPLYGFGKSEELVGRALKSRRGKALVATKCILRWDREEGTFHGELQGLDGRMIKIYKNGRAKELIWECEQSLRRLDVDVIDLYQIHWPDQGVPIEESIEGLVRLKEQGKIRAIGVSNFNVEQMKAAQKVTQIASLQPPYSILRRAVEKHQLPFCIEQNIGVICYSPMERGLLTGAASPTREFPLGDHRANHPYFKPENRAKVQKALERISPICNRHSATFAQIILNWTIGQKGITAAIVGARNAKQMEENIGALRFKLSEGEMKHIEEIFEEECGDFVRRE